MVRIQVTLDVFSGNPNPSWELSEDKVKEFFEMKGWKESMLHEENEIELDLGYRGFIMSVMSSKAAKKDSTKTKGFIQERHIGLPNTFRIYSPKKAAEGMKKSMNMKEMQDNELWLLNTSKGKISKRFENEKEIGNGGLSQELFQYVEKTISQEKTSEESIQESTGEERESTSEKAISQIYNPPFWNNPSWVKLNNCYNYASNSRTNTFAQPGRAHGQKFLMNCTSVRDAAFADGVLDDSLESIMGQNYHVALVIWPGQDYHWYTYHDEGFWGHKPGGTPARNWDAQDRIINPRGSPNLTPYNCNRGPYTQFCGFYYIPENIAIQ